MRDMFTSPKRPFYQSTLMMPIDVISEDAYYAFAERFFRKAGRQLERSVFHALYERFQGIIWYMQALLWNLYSFGDDVIAVAQVDEAVQQRILANEYDQQRVLELLPDGARRLVKAIAAERIVKSPQLGEFIAKHALRAASSVKVALDMLLDKEIVYQGKDGYVVYDRLFAEYLRNHP